MWVQLLLDGLWSGVRIEFNPSSSCQLAVANMPSVLAHSEVVQAYLDAERAAGNLAGPFSTAELPGVIFNQFGAIPIANKPGKWRLIVDLSHPSENNVNDGILESDASMQYSRIDDAARLILDAGCGAFWPRLMLLAPSVLFQCTPATDTCWACSGKTWPSLISTTVWPQISPDAFQCLCGCS